MNFVSRAGILAAPFNIIIDFVYLVLILLGFKLQYQSQITTEMKAEEYTQMLKLTRNLVERSSAVDASRIMGADATDADRVPIGAVQALHEQIKVGGYRLQVCVTMQYVWLCTMFARWIGFHLYTCPDRHLVLLF